MIAPPVVAVISDDSGVWCGCYRLLQIFFLANRKRLCYDKERKVNKLRGSVKFATDGICAQMALPVVTHQPVSHFYDMIW